MPHPHEQKLQEVVNSLTFDSFMSAVAARMARTSRSPPSANPDPPPRVSLNRSRRLIDDFREGAQPDLSTASSPYQVARNCELEELRVQNRLHARPSRIIGY